MRGGGESKLLSTIYGAPLGQGKKFIASTKVMRGYLEIEISPRIKERKFREIKFVGFRRLPTHSSTLQEVGIIPTLVYFPFLGWK